MSTEKNGLQLRDLAAVVMSASVISAFVFIGFLKMVAFLVFGIEVEIPGDWMSAMLSLASACTGYLLGRTDVGAGPPPVAKDKSNGA